MSRKIWIIDPADGILRQATYDPTGDSEIGAGVRAERQIIGDVYSVEFVVDGEQEDDDDRDPGTYVTVRVPDGTAWTPGTVLLRYASIKPDTNN